MTPYWHDPFLTIHEGDCREVMAQMEPESVHTVVTSPPYWGLRDYGTATWLGGDEGCDHINGALASDKSTLAGYTSENIKLRTNGMPYSAACGKCGAVRQDSQLGLEPTPEEYVENMVAVFREVKRVLRKDGTCWVNLGDSYAGGNQGGTYNPETWKPLAGGPSDNTSWQKRSQRTNQSTVVSGLKPKDLVGIPWRVAFALQADGWYLRSDIIWSKPNPMPESVTDRPTKAHEYLFLLSKSPRYYYDADAVREPHAEPWRGNGEHESGTPHSGRLDGGEQAAFTVARRQYNPAGRNLRTVWSIATQPYPGAHFATFPEALVEPCVKAGTSEKGVCPECGAPWVREVERVVGVDWNAHKRGNDRLVYGNGTGATQDKARIENPPRTIGWQPPDCGHHDAYTGLHEPPVPAVVLDPFAGSGTTGRVAQRLGRRAVLIDLSGEYLTQAMRRNQDIPLGLETA